MRAADGSATGLLREKAGGAVAAAAARSRAAMSALELARESRREVELAGAEALANGITTFHDAGASFDKIDFYRTLEEEGSLPIRLYVMVRGASNEEMAEKLAAYRMPAEADDYLVVRSIKRQIDGALGAHGAWLLEPYADLPASSGLVLEPVAEIERTAELALEHGYQLNTHAIGDRGNREVLDLYERAFQAVGDASDTRWRVEHAQHLQPDDIPRFAELGVIASVQGTHCTSDGPWIPRRLGDERTESTSYRWRDLLDSGAVINNGTDVPVEDIDPIASFYASVARVMTSAAGGGEAFHPSQGMTREEALRSYTAANAYAAFEEAEKGSLEVGKLADLVVLSQDLLEVPAADIPATQVDLTILGGEVVYRREQRTSASLGELPKGVAP